MSDYIWEKSQEEKIKGEQPTKISQLENDVGFITNNDLPTTYPPSEHKHTKNDITDFPTSLPANGGIAGAIAGKDTRNDDSPPSEYMNGGTLYVGRVGIIPEFKLNAILNTGLLGIYCMLVTFVPWPDRSGGYPFQIAMGNGGMCYRVGISVSEWSTWSKVATV